MKKVWTTEHLRKEENRIFPSLLVLIIGLIISVPLMLSTRVIPESLINLAGKTATVFYNGSLLYFILCAVLYLRVYLNVDSKNEGKKLKKDLGINKLSFRKLSDKSYEMHHHEYTNQEIDEMFSKGMSSDDITRIWKEQLMNDFKRLESFIRTEELQGRSVNFHTYTHVRMYKTWNKIAQDAGIVFEVVKDNNQKPVGFKWSQWKKVVYKTNGKKATKDSIPKADEWNKYILTSKAD